jgi:monothiol glutaredoxin
MKSAAVTTSLRSLRAFSRIARTFDVTLRSVSSSATMSTLASEAQATNYTRACFLTKRNFSDSGSHDDFAPKKKASIENEDEAFNVIAQQVKDNPIMLYMKGNPSMPMCGFSSRVVNIMKAEGVDFSSVNVLEYDQIREGVKKYSAWPTIPQLYINGEFVGGCDIVTEMHENGELKELLVEVSGDKSSE